MDETKRGPGRPTMYTDALGERIAAAYAAGISFKEILAQDWAPAAQMTLVEWEEKYPRFSVAMTRARASHAEVLVDTLEDVLDKERDPQRARVLVDIRRFKASKMSPRYADKVQVDVEHKVSLGDALREGLQRITRPDCDLADVTDAQFQEVQALGDATTTDAPSSAADDEPEWMR